jgi:hypothetical protein
MRASMWVNRHGWWPDPASQWIEWSFGKGAMGEEGYLLLPPW